MSLLQHDATWPIDILFYVYGILQVNEMKQREQKLNYFSVGMLERNDKKADFILGWLFVIAYVNWQ